MVKSYEVDWAWGKELAFWLDETALEQLSQDSSMGGRGEVKLD